MGDRSGIEWTDATWNPVVGCSVMVRHGKRRAGRTLDRQLHDAWPEVRL